MVKANIQRKSRRPPGFVLHMFVFRYRASLEVDFECHYRILESIKEASLVLVDKRGFFH